MFHLESQANAPGLLILEPIYSLPKPQTVEARRQQLLGFAYGSMIANGPWAGRGSLTNRALVAWTFCGSADPKALGFRGGGERETTGAAESALTRMRTLNLFGRGWQLQFRSLPALERSPERALPWIVFLAGLTISGALSLIAASQARARRAAETHAENLRAAEDAILREKRFSEEILNDMPGVFVLLDDAGRLIKWNRFLEEITGLPGSELRALRGGELFGLGGAGGVQEHSAEVFEKGRAQMEIRLRAKEGKSVPYYFTGYRFQTADKAFCIGIALDLSQKEKSDREIETVQQLMRQVIACAQQGMAVYDKSLRCVVWNPYWENLSGIDAVRASGQTPSALFEADLARRIERRLREVLSGGHPAEESYEAKFVG
ncbi:MAG: PAS domain S-box protein, partial [Verrucomicrobia bacterium]|nr:PAS domain S-box protein [Verrucomicrobiota bacterium]